ncbi:MAG: hypothetical protein Q3X72_01825 [Candidatus Copromonas sp.]|nr:hypothetical protein [Candidatus Copromonas sp.]
MNGQQWAPMCAGFAVAVVLFLVLGYFLRKRDMTAHLAPVKRELKKEKQWLRRGEYNAAMVKGRQNLELFLKLVAEFNGIKLDNSAQAMANAKSGPDGRGQRETYRMNGRKRQRVMTFQQFGWWLDENGYLDRVGKWELNEIRVIGNKAVHENYVSKEDAWNQYNYMEDVLRIVADHHANRRKQRGPAVKKSQTGCHGASVKKTSVAQMKERGQGQSKSGGQSQAGKSQAKNSGQGHARKREGGKQTSGGNARQDAKVSGNQRVVQKTEGKKTAEQKSTENKQTLRKPQNGSNGKAAGKNETSERTQQKREVKTAVNKAQQSREVKIVEKTAENAQPEKLSSSAKRRQRRKRAKAAREQAEAAGMVRGTAPQSKAAKPTEKIAEPTEKTVKPTEKRTVCHGKETDRQPRQVQPQTSMRIVTLSQPTGGWTAGTDKKETVKSEKSKRNTAPQLKRKSGEAEKRTQGNIAARQTQNEGTADPTARRRRRPKRRPAAEHAGNNVGRTAAGGGDHEE